METLSQNYGKEVVIDLVECSTDKMTQEGLTEFFDKLCILIDMEKIQVHFWGSEGITKEEWDANPHLQGISACQFIKTSSIVIHAITGLKCLYLNCFSCKDFDSKKVEDFSALYFAGKLSKSTTIDRVR